MTTWRYCAPSCIGRVSGLPLNFRSSSGNSSTRRNACATRRHNTRRSERHRPPRARGSQYASHARAKSTVAAVDFIPLNHFTVPVVICLLRYVHCETRASRLNTEYRGRDLVSSSRSVSQALHAFGATFPLRGAERPSAMAAARNVWRCCACTGAACPVSKGVGHDLYLLS